MHRAGDVAEHLPTAIVIAERLRSPGETPYTQADAAVRHRGRVAPGRRPLSPTLATRFRLPPQRRRSEWLTIWYRPGMAATASEARKNLWYQWTSLAPPIQAIEGTLWLEIAPTRGPFRTSPGVIGRLPSSRGRIRDDRLGGLVRGDGALFEPGCRVRDERPGPDPPPHAYRQPRCLTRRRGNP